MTEIAYNPEDIISRFDQDNLLPTYFKLLLDENKKINLVSRETAEGSLYHLAAESLLPLTTIKLKENASYLDIGSGGGFPAIPVIITQNLASASLVERTQKKAAAMRRMLLALKKRVDIQPVSFENFKADSESFDLITLRLVKLTNQMLAQILPLLKPDGTFIYYSKTELEIDVSLYLKRDFTISSGKSSFTIINRI